MQLAQTSVHEDMVTLADYPGAAAQLVIAYDPALGIHVYVTATSAPSAWPTGAVYFDGQVADGGWHHVAVTVQGAGPSAAATVSCYVDGRAAAVTSPGPLTVPASLNVLTVGGRDDLLNLGQAQLMAGSVYGLVLTDLAAVPGLPSFAAHYAAAATGFAGERVDQRITRIARYAGVPARWLNLGACVSVCGPQPCAGRLPLDVMREAARTENSPLFCAGDGRITIHPRTARYNRSPAWTVQASEVDPATAFPDDFSYTANQVDTSTASGTATRANNPASQAKYGVYGTSVQTACATAADAAALGQWLAAQNGDPPHAQLPQAAAGMFFEGVTEVIDSAAHTFEIAASPNTSGNVHQLDTAPQGQLDAGFIIAY